MIHALALLLTVQLAGVVLTGALGLAVPGPVLGMALLLAALMAVPRLVAVVAPTARVILGHLAILFVPAGVGVVGHIARLGDEALAVGLAIAVSTVLAIVVGALTFVAVARLTDRSDRADRDA
ncbi:CidA/LrgA family protein [Rhodobaculum claviforme]|uniref:CidA/LrgA family protein n=1 Tax=Rhodobaculum claviforme TaxID=1549854 RepID=A0A934TJS2_9RHOB|nr:CidA/LrgA family protein [Rhodobaculum claviforme]MBK5926903.1 hypothetical protein [Rhodobaculum claviforme]